MPSYSPLSQLRMDFAAAFSETHIVYMDDVIDRQGAYVEIANLLLEYLDLGKYSFSSVEINNTLSITRILYLTVLNVLRDKGMSDVQVISWFIKKEGIGCLSKCTGQENPLFFTPGKGNKSP